MVRKPNFNLDQLGASPGFCYHQTMSVLFVKAMVSLLVAIDAIGAVPLIAGLTKGMTTGGRQKLVNKASLAAFAIGVIFIFGGQAIFHFLGITENDFRVAGGILLLVFSIRDLSSDSSHQGAEAPSSLGIVPIAIPLMMGPAALTTLMISTKEYGFLFTILSLSLNLIFAWVLFSRASWLLNRIGSEASEAFAKISSLFLAAIAVMLIRLGFVGML